jgi:hypothetical protein
MSQARLSYWLDRPVDEAYDHVLGSPDAPITLVEYGSYACPYCRAANERIAEVRDQLGDRLRYVFRHGPLTGSDIARRAAELAELAGDPDRFWKAHIELMTRSETLTEDDLVAVAADLGLAQEDPQEAEEAARRAKARVEADESSARASGVMITPTFFINRRRYDGPWDESSSPMRCSARSAIACARPPWTSPAGGRPQASCSSWRRCWRWRSPTRRWSPASTPSGSRTSASRSMAPALSCRCGTGSTMAC